MADFNFIYNFNLISSLLLFFGLFLVIVEMFHPGFGAPGTMGIILLILSIYNTAANVSQAILMLLSITILLGIVLIFVIRSAAKGRLSKILVLSDSLKKESGYSGTENFEEYVGKDGIVITTLRPAGMADFEGVKLDVVSQGEYVDKGTKVKVLKVEGRRIIVKETE